MKSKANSVLIVIALLAYCLSLLDASAFYDPSTQRWVSRDPLGDIASLPEMTADIAPWADQDDVDQATGDEMLLAFVQVNQNIHTFEFNSPVNHFDPFGLCDGVPGMGPGEANPANYEALDTRSAYEVAQAKLKRSTLDAIQDSKVFSNAGKLSKNIDINKLKQVLNREQLQKAKEIAQEAIKFQKQKLREAVTEKQRQTAINAIETQLNRAQACKRALAP